MMFVWVGLRICDSRVINMVDVHIERMVESSSYVDKLTMSDVRCSSTDSGFVQCTSLLVVYFLSKSFDDDNYLA